MPETLIASAPLAAPIVDPGQPVAAELTFPLGLPGFPAVDRFELRPIAGRSPFHLLHGLGAVPVDLVVVPLDVLAHRIAAADVETVRQGLQIDAGALLVLLVVTFPARASGQAPTVNLRAPLFVDVERGTAVQAVLQQPDYPFRQPLAA